MARKTYHHLAVGTDVLVQHVHWDHEKNELEVVQSFAASVTENDPRRKTLVVDVLDCYRGRPIGSRHDIEISRAPSCVEHVTISKQSGSEWGSDLDSGCFRIDPVYAAPKVQGKPAPA